VGIWLLDFLLLKAVSGEEDGSFHNSMAAAARLVASIYIHRERLGGVKADLADPAEPADAADPAALATVEITQQLLILQHIHILILETWRKK
jgi:hypothetical protein